MNRKEKKKDVAIFANMMKELMQEPMDDPLMTLDRDTQHFIYGRVATLVKHNDDKAVGSLSDIGTVVGAALADVIKEFTRGRLEGEKLQEAFAAVRQNILVGFDARTPEPTAETSDQQEEVAEETAQEETVAE